MLPPFVDAPGQGDPAELVKARGRVLCSAHRSETEAPHFVRQVFR